MFGKKAETQPVIFFGAQGDTHNYHTHHEHRAPTDDSIRLATEMQEKVKEAIISSIKVENSVIPMHLHAAKVMDMLRQGTEMVLTVVINGEQLHVREFIDPLHAMQPDGMEVIVGSFHHKVSEAIAGKLLDQAFKKATTDTLNAIHESFAK